MINYRPRMQQISKGMGIFAKFVALRSTLREEERVAKKNLSSPIKWEVFFHLSLLETTETLGFPAEFGIITHIRFSFSTLKQRKSQFFIRIKLLTT